MITLIEKVNPHKVQFLLKQGTIHEDEGKNHNIKVALDKYIKGFKKNKRFEAVYKTSKDLGSTKSSPDGWGRIYPNNNFGKSGSITGLTMFDKVVRSYLAQDAYIDVDMKKSHWFILKHLLVKSSIGKGLVEKVLDSYNEMSQWLEKTCKVTDIKGGFFSVINSSPNTCLESARLCWINFQYSLNFILWFTKSLYPFSRKNLENSTLLPSRRLKKKIQMEPF